MPKDPRSFQKAVVHPALAALVVPVVAKAILTTTAQTVQLFRAPVAMRVRGAHFASESASDATQTVKVSNLTKAVDVTAALTIGGVVGANGGAAMVLSTTSANLDVVKGDIIALVHTNSGGVVAADEATVSLEVQLV